MSSPRAGQPAHASPGRRPLSQNNETHFAYPGSPASAYKTSKGSPSVLASFMSGKALPVVNGAGGAGGSILKERATNQFGSWGARPLSGSMHPPPVPSASRPSSTTEAPRFQSTISPRPYSAYTSDSPFKRKATFDDDQDESVHSDRRTSSPPRSHDDGGSYYSDRSDHLDNYDQIDDEQDEQDQQDERSSVSPPPGQGRRRPSPSQDSRPEAEPAVPASDGTIVDDYYLNDQADEPEGDDASSRVEAEAEVRGEAQQETATVAHAEQQDEQEQHHPSDARAAPSSEPERRHSSKRARSEPEDAEANDLPDNPYSRLYQKIAKNDIYSKAQRESEAKWSAVDADDREAWDRGGEELIAKAKAVLDQVKDHVVDRINLYTSVEERVDEHKDELAINAYELDSTAKHLKQWGDQIVSSVNVGTEADAQ